MYLSRIQIFNYKNHVEQMFEFCPEVNGITGLNGSGKTNILDAVYYLSNAKSFFNGIDQQLIRHGSDFFSIHGWFGAEPDFDILASFSEKGKKTLKKNGKVYPRLLDHIGLIQAVFITPYDISLVLEGSEERRRFMDYTLCQTDRDYLEKLSFYKKLQDQRNAFLKKCEGRYVDPDVLESYDARMSPVADALSEARRTFISILMPWFAEFYEYLTSHKESVSLEYVSELTESSMAALLQENRERDRILMRTSAGIHKDDLELQLQGNPLKKFGSQGQIKSFVIAMKLAQYRYFLEKTGQKPLLLLDDIFEKIDAERAGKLMELVARDYFGQIFITDTHADRVRDHLKEVQAEQRFYELGK